MVQAVLQAAVDSFLPQARSQNYTELHLHCQCCTSLLTQACFAARVAFRNRGSTIVRLVVAPFLFILLVFVINKAISAGNQSIARNSLQPHTTANAINGIPPCEDDLYANVPCWDVIYTPNDSTVVDAIVQGIQANNPGRIIPSTKVSPSAVHLLSCFCAPLPT